VSKARVLLHAAAVVLPLLVAAALMTSSFFRGAEDFLALAGMAVAAAQLAALPGWWLLDRSAHRPGWIRSALAGLAIALLTHLLFGVVLELWMVLRDVGSGRVRWDSVYTSLRNIVFVAGLSCVVAGWATAPAVMLLCVWLQRLRRGELAKAGDSRQEQHRVAAEVAR
jgi:succinate dehydrogenase/fumarate reductase cytochrome b subunit